ncbi:MAG: hypothetical protein ACI395_09430 [Candidatus Cryptobacteroides sp.]
MAVLFLAGLLATGCKKESVEGDGPDGKTPVVTVENVDVTDATATFTGKVSPASLGAYQVGIEYSTDKSFAEGDSTTKLRIRTVGEDGSFSVSATGLSALTEYNYRTYVTEDSKEYTYGSASTFTTTGEIKVTVDASGATTSSVVFSGNVSLVPAGTEIGISISESNKPDSNSSDIPVTRVSIVDKLDASGNFSFTQDGLSKSTTYYYCYYIKTGETYTFGEVKNFVTAAFVSGDEIDFNAASDLSSSESANCYIVSKAGTYKFATVKGNDKGQTLPVASAEILWESFGSSSVPQQGDLVSTVAYRDGYVAFMTAPVFTKGNASIAVKDAAGTILWSWHIWFTDQPAEHIYPNNAGTMMDRNLGATAVKGDGDCGLIYEWGRKDPFLGGTGAIDAMNAKSTITWPTPVQANATIGTIEWSIQNPTTYIWNKVEYANLGTTDAPIWKPTGNSDWVYNPACADGSTEKIIETGRWGSVKTIYDPCPAGWRVPDGGDNSIWNVAGFSSNNVTRISSGVEFTISSGTTWFPAAGCRAQTDGKLDKVGTIGYYWAATVDTQYGTQAHKFHFNFDYWTELGSAGSFSATGKLYPAWGMSVRCCKIK